MTSEISYREAFVWAWLPGRTQSVFAGRLAREGSVFVFNYGRSYLARPDAIALYEPELPLKAGALPLQPGLLMPNSLRDAAPDAWGRRVILNRLSRRQDGASEPDELTYLLESGSDRIGALDFQQSATDYLPRQAASATLGELLEAAGMVERGPATDA